ncbi:MAG: radical SAM protein [bacterium]
MKRLNLMINSTCHCRCQMCDIWRVNGPEMSMDTVQRAAAIARSEGCHRVLLTGGEPTLHSRFDSIVKLLSDEGFELGMCTDGVSLLPYAELVAEKFRRVIISMDAPDRETYKKVRGVDSFHAVCGAAKTIKSLVGEKLELTLAFLIQPLNYRLLKNWYVMARTLPVDALSIQLPNGKNDIDTFVKSRSTELRMVRGFSRLDLERLLLLLDEVFLEDRLSERPLLQESDWARRHYRRYLETWRDSGSPLAPRQCALPANSISVMPDGSVKPCFVLPFEFGHVSGAPEARSARAEFLGDPALLQRINSAACERCVVFVDSRVTAA